LASLGTGVFAFRVKIGSLSAWQASLPISKRPMRTPFRRASRAELGLRVVPQPKEKRRLLASLGTGVFTLRVKIGSLSAWQASLPISKRPMRTPFRLASRAERDLMGCAPANRKRTPIGVLFLLCYHYKKRPNRTVLQKQSGFFCFKVHLSLGIDGS